MFNILDIHVYKFSMKKYILLILFLHSFGLFCQTPKGLYRGFLDNNIGYFYFNTNSSFIFCGAERLINNELRSKKELIFNDTLIKFGIGKWIFDDSILQVRFDKFPGELINGNYISYKSYTAKPYDSLLLNIKLLNKDSKSPGVGVITFNSVHGAILTDKQGILKRKFSLNIGDSSIEIKKLFYEKQIITLAKGCNVHEISIQFSKEKMPQLKLIDNLTYLYTIHENMRADYFGKKPFIQDEGGSEKIRRLLIKNMKYFPMQQKIYQILLEAIKNV